MSKMIAVWGSPNSGKTTFATKLARSIYDENINERSEERILDDGMSCDRKYSASLYAEHLVV